MKLIVDKVFKSAIPPLEKDEYRQLEYNLLAEGCRDPLVVWGDTLIDGHNRLRICEKHGIPYQVVQREFADRSDAMAYIIQNQLGRRNLSLAYRSILVLKLDLYIKDEAKENQRRSQGRGKKGSQNSGDLFGGMNTDKALGLLAGVSHDTIHKTRKIMEYGTPAQIGRVEKGGKGNSVNAVYKEVRDAMRSVSPGLGGTIIPNLSPTDDVESFMAQYTAFVGGIIHSMKGFTHDQCVAMYSQMELDERKYWLEMNEAVVMLFERNIVIGIDDIAASKIDS